VVSRQPTRTNPSYFVAFALMSASEDSNETKSLSKVVRKTYRSLTEALYRQWVPDKLDKVDFLMQKYQGQEDQVYYRAVKLYVFSGTREMWQPLIEGMYKRFNPSKLQTLDSILEKYSGSEMELFKALCDKYINELKNTDPPFQLHSSSDDLDECKEDTRSAPAHSSKQDNKDDHKASRKRGSCSVSPCSPEPLTKEPRKGGTSWSKASAEEQQEEAPKGSVACPESTGKSSCSPGEHVESAMGENAKQGESAKQWTAASRDRSSPDAQQTEHRPKRDGVRQQSPMQARSPPDPRRAHRSREPERNREGPRERIPVKPHAEVQQQQSGPPSQANRPRVLLKALSEARLAENNQVAGRNASMRRRSRTRCRCTRSRHSALNLSPADARRTNHGVLNAPSDAPKRSDHKLRSSRVKDLCRRSMARSMARSMVRSQVGSRRTLREMPEAPQRHTADEVALYERRHLSSNIPAEIAESQRTRSRSRNQATRKATHLMTSRTPVHNVAKASVQMNSARPPARSHMDRQIVGKTSSKRDPEEPPTKVIGKFISTSDSIERERCADTGARAQRFNEQKSQGPHASYESYQEASPALSVSKGRPLAASEHAEAPPTSRPMTSVTSPVALKQSNKNGSRARHEKPKLEDRDVEPCYFEISAEASSTTRLIHVKGSMTLGEMAKLYDRFMTLAAPGPVGARLDSSRSV